MAMSTFYDALRNTDWASTKKATFYLSNDKKVSMKASTKTGGRKIAYDATLDAITYVNDDKVVPVVPVESIVSCDVDYIEVEPTPDPDPAP